MRIIDLSAEEKTALELRHKKTRDVKESDRIKAILLRSENWSIPMISQALRIHQSTVVRHLDDYKRGKLTISSGGSYSSLNLTETTELITHLEEYTYHTTQEIIAYVKSRYDVDYSIPGMNKWLHRKGFSYKKPKGYPYKASKEKQEEFVKNYYQLKENLGDGEKIFFMDSCHPSMATKVSYGWIKKGKEKPIETTASRTRINLIGALNLNELSNPIVCSYSTVDGDAIVDFFQQLRRYSNISGVIHLILDQAGYHQSDYVKKEAENFKIKIHYLPPHSPNLNPIERLWKVMNEYARNNRFFANPKEFKQSITSFFTKTVPKISSDLGKRINDNFQMLEYAF